MTDLIYKDLSYKLTGLVYEIDNSIGYGQSEKIYADILEKILIREKIAYSREVYFPIKIDNKVVKKFYFDFIIENKIVVELKASDINYKQVCSQLFKYLKVSNLKLGLVFRFTKSGVRHKRIPNFI